MKPSISTIALALATALAAGCASTTVPPARVASTESAVQSARAAGADRVPDASAHLKAAEDQLGRAKNLIEKKKDSDQAEALLSRAKSDAALAVALSQQARQEQEAQQKAKMGPPVSPNR
jgi:Domain of unknown function (DUF4398)